MNVAATEIDITPHFPVDLAGFASRSHPSSGVLEPIFARALYLEDEPSGEKLLWLACDVIALQGDFVAAFRQWTRENLGLEERQVLLSATHTHSAPATIDLNGAGRFSQRYATLLRGKLEELARRAVGRIELGRGCRVVAAQAPVDIAVHRRGPASAHTDPVVSAVGFLREDGQFAAAIVNYAMHPVALGHAEERISPDWCGAAAAAVHAQLPGRPVTLVSNGAAGNLNPPAVGMPPLEVARMGRVIGGAAAAAIKEATASPFVMASPADARLRIASTTVDMPLDWMDAAAVKTHVHETIASIKRGWEWETIFQYAVSAWGGEVTHQVQQGGGHEHPVEIQVIRIGGEDQAVTIVAINGELFSKFTAMVRDALGNPPNLFVVGYANAAFGYVPSREAYAEGGYEVEQAHFFYNTFRPKVGSLEMLAAKATELVRSLS